MNTIKFGLGNSVAGAFRHTIMLTLCAVLAGAFFVPAAHGADGVEEITVPDAIALEGKEIFSGSYQHRSRGQAFDEPALVRIVEGENGSRSIYVKMPYQSGVFIAEGNASMDLIRFRAYYPRKDGGTAYIDATFDEEGARITRRQIREDWDGKALAVPAGAYYDPNSRPDAYAAAYLQLARLKLAAGQSVEQEVYDFDNSGDAFAAYKIRFTHHGREAISTPAGRFDATRYTLEQVTSADTWFKKRAGHVTDFWILDNGVIVRVVRQREPYEVELLEAAGVEALPGYLGVKPADAASGG